MFYFGQIIYGFIKLYNILLDTFAHQGHNVESINTLFSLTWLINNRVHKSFINFVQILKKIEINIDIKDDDEFNTLEQAICHSG